jgi:hypothetical protein
MPNLSIRLNDKDVETLDRLVIGVRAYYEREAKKMPALHQLAKETTRSSALRDLLSAWDHGMDAPKVFSRDLTAPAKNGG